MRNGLTRAATAASGKEVNYDLPPGRRGRVANASGVEETAMTTEAGGEEYFDIPAFLRRQAD